MMEEGHVLTHLGLGDQIACNGLIRELYKLHSKLYVYSKLKYFYSVEFMFRDLENLHVLPMEEGGAISFASYYKIKNFYRIRYPFDNMPSDTVVEKGFYYQAGIDFEKKWESFFVKRNPEREENLFNRLGLKPNEYVFLHDDKSRGQTIDEDRIAEKGLKIVRADPEYTNNVFDFCKIIENSREVHVIESCIMCMIDLVFQNTFRGVKGKLFEHRYAKPIKPFEYPTNKLDWRIYV